jgi:hypothetical protein
MELKPCPFCGGSAEIRKMPNAKLFKARCSGVCGVSVCKTGWTKEEAAKKWNVRHDYTKAERLST